MKRYHLPVLITLATALAIAGCRDPIAPQAAEDKQKTPVAWEYNEKRIFLTLGNLEALRAELNKEGDQGWELVSVTPLQPIESTHSGYVQSLGIFKRAKR
jgi:hypothetical protein